MSDPDPLDVPDLLTALERALHVPHPAAYADLDAYHHALATRTAMIRGAVLHTLANPDTAHWLADTLRGHAERGVPYAVRTTD